MPLADVVDAPGVERAAPAHQTVHLVALLEQQLGEIAAVLPGDPRDERLLRRHVLLRAARLAGGEAPRIYTALGTGSVSPSAAGRDRRSGAGCYDLLGGSGRAAASPAEVGIVIRLLSRRLVPVLLALRSVACPDFQPDPPGGPDARSPAVSASPRSRSSTASPQHCANAADHCQDRGRLLRQLDGARTTRSCSTRPPDPTFWTGVVDERAGELASERRAALRPGLRPAPQETRRPPVAPPRASSSAGRSIYFYDSTGTPEEAGLIYVDDNGVGHNPY